MWEVRFGDRLTASLWFDGTLLSVCGGVIVNRLRNQAVDAMPIAMCRQGRISQVANSGEIVVLNDGSVWRVHMLDKYKVSIWLSSTRVVACNGLLINVNRSRAVRATRVA